MLVISRREGERIQIGNGITITVVRVDPHSVRLGIEAPTETVVMRSELLVRLQSEPRAENPSQTSAPNKPR